MDEEVTIIDPEGDLLIILIPESDPVDSESNSNSDSDGTYHLTTDSVACYLEAYLLTVC